MNLGELLLPLNRQTRLAQWFSVAMDASLVVEGEARGPEERMNRPSALTSEDGFPMLG